MKNETNKISYESATTKRPNMAFIWGRRIVFLLLVLAAGRFVILPKMKARQTMPAPVSARPIVVRTVTVMPQSLEFTRDYTARIIDDTRTLVSARLNTTIAKTYVKEGDVVNAGDVIALLDTKDVRTEVGRAKAGLAKIEADIAFFENQINIDRKLYDGGAIPKTALDDSERKLKGLRATITQQNNNLKLSTQKLGYGKIYAPISGRIQKIFATQGEQVAPGKPIVEIIGSGAFKAVISVPERDMAHLNVADIVYLKKPDNVWWRGKIDRIYPALDPHTHTGTFDVRLDNTIAQDFFAGSMTRAKLVSDSFDNVLFVPTQAIFQRGGTSGVFVVTDNIAHWTPVSLGHSDGTQTVIKDGLVTGQNIIITPYPSLNEGVKIVLAGSNPS
jgi:RND family efflux transporter MFP subunit